MKIRQETVTIVKMENFRNLQKNTCLYIILIFRLNFFPRIFLYYSYNKRKYNFFKIIYNWIIGKLSQKVVHFILLIINRSSFAETANFI